MMANAAKKNVNCSTQSATTQTAAFQQNLHRAKIKLSQITRAKIKLSQITNLNYTMTTWQLIQMASC